MSDKGKPAIPDVLPRFVAYRKKNPVWGSLHIVLEDRNVDNAHVEFCREYAERNGDAEGVALAEILLSMSKTQRFKIGGMCDE